MEYVNSTLAGVLTFNPDNERYGLSVNGRMEYYGFHCSEPLEVMVDGTWVQTRMDMDSQKGWYLKGTPYAGNLENIEARIVRRVPANLLLHRRDDPPLLLRSPHGGGVHFRKD